MPQLAFGGGRPTPRNDSVDSSRMLIATVSVPYTMIVPTRCGSRCERMIRKLLDPTMRAASMNSFSRSESTCARMIRAG